MGPTSVFGGWLGEWRLRRGAAGYVRTISAEPDEDDVRWLAAVATSDDADRARWELRYARRALGLLVAERDALDDRTASVVARILRDALQVDRSIAAGMVRIAERQLNERLASYRHVLSDRNPAEGTATRLGRTLLRSANAGRTDSAAVERAGALLAQYLGASNEALRKAFGVASLPEDRPPSDLFKGAGR
jgi:hypothetical protein